MRCCRRPDPLEPPLRPRNETAHPLLQPLLETLSSNLSSKQDGSTSPRKRDGAPSPPTTPRNSLLQPLLEPLRETLLETLSSCLSPKRDGSTLPETKGFNLPLGAAKARFASSLRPMPPCGTRGGALHEARPSAPLGCRRGMGGLVEACVAPPPVACRANQAPVDSCDAPTRPPPLATHQPGMPHEERHKAQARLSRRQGAAASRHAPTRRARRLSRHHEERPQGTGPPVAPTRRPPPLAARPASCANKAAPGLSRHMRSATCGAAQEARARLPRRAPTSLALTKATTTASRTTCGASHTPRCTLHMRRMAH